MGRIECPMLFVRLLLFLLAILIAYLVASLMAGRPIFLFPGGLRRTRRIRRTGGESPRRGADREAGRGSGGGGGRGKPKTCPVCGEILGQGERIKTVVFQGGLRSGGVTEKMCRIYGCPRCYPANPRHPRVCPVCGSTVPAEGHLEARMFERPDRPRKHVHVLGCTGCRKPHLS